MSESTPDPTEGSQEPAGDGDEPTPWVADVDPEALGGYTPPPDSDLSAPPQSAHASLGADLERLAADLASDLGDAAEDTPDTDAPVASDEAEDLPDGGWDDIAVPPPPAPAPAAPAPAPGPSAGGGDLLDDDAFDLADLEQAVVEFGFEEDDAAASDAPAPAAGTLPPPAGGPLPPPSGSPTPGPPPAAAPPPAPGSVPAPPSAGTVPPPPAPTPAPAPAPAVAETPVDPEEAGIDMQNFTARGGSGAVTGSGAESSGKRFFGR